MSYPGKEDCCHGNLRRHAEVYENLHLLQCHQPSLFNGKASIGIRDLFYGVSRRYC